MRNFLDEPIAMVIVAIILGSIFITIKILKITGYLLGSIFITISILKITGYLQ